jgi:4TM region of pyridine nucleotide transhydrogenase, mitoch
VAPRFSRGAVSDGGVKCVNGRHVDHLAALFASMTNIVSGFLFTDRMLKMFKTGLVDDRR